jgi:hypothetical protein
MAHEPSSIAKVGSLDAKPFLATHRAASVCTREVDRVCEGLVLGVRGLHAENLGEKPVVRRSPGRCIVQFGPVAITVTWLRGQLDTVEGGELLVVVWQGSVAPPREHHPERVVTERARSSAQVLWEQSFRPFAPNEGVWEWVPAGAPSKGLTSSELVARCAEQLRMVSAESPVPPPAEVLDRPTSMHPAPLVARRARFA